MANCTCAQCSVFTAASANLFTHAHTIHHLPLPLPPCSSTERVEDIMDDISDQMNIAEEISEAISNPVGGALDDDVRWFVFFACCVLLANKLGCSLPHP